MIEVGVSESLRGLRRDADRWIQESGGDVKIVAVRDSTVKADRAIFIEKWEPKLRNVSRAVFYFTLP